MEWWDVKLVRPAFVICTDIDCVSKNVPTLASCSFDKHLPILIIFGQEHQHTFGNNMHIQLSLYLYFYLLYLLLNSCDGNDAKQRVFLDRLLVAAERAGCVVCLLCKEPVLL